METDQREKTRKTQENNKADTNSITSAKTISTLLEEKPECE